MTPYEPYPFDYYYETPGMEAFAEIGGMVLAFVFFFYIAMLALTVAAYVFQSLSLYTIAKRRGIHNPWLSWLPVGNMWILGSISDQYQYVAKGRVRNRRKLLLGLMIAMYALVVLMYIGIFGLILGVAGEIGSLAGVGITLTLLPALAVVVVGVIAVVYEFIAIYDLYRSCDPDNGVLYLVLSIIFTISIPVFLFVCRKKDLGMPPRKTAVQQPVLDTGLKQEAPVEEVQE